MALELNRPDIRRAGTDADVDEEDGDTVDEDDAEAIGASGLAPDIDDRLVLVPLGDACVLTGGESGEVGGKLENALVCELVDPDDPLPDDVASIGDSVLPLPVPPGDACFEGAEKTLDENRLDDPPPLLAPCDGWDEGVAMPCVDDDDEEGADGERCSTGLELVADLPFAFLLGSVALFGRGPPARFLLLSSPPPPLPWPPPLPLPPLLPPALNMGHPWCTRT